jgi:tetratricopeptide (TPR) repeat protein
MPYHPPQLADIDGRDAAIYGEVMEGCYRFHDMMLDALLSYAGDGTTAVLISDHGFQSGVDRPSPNAWVQPETWHRQFGIACLSGPGVRQGETLYGASLLDVTPTILSLFGLPLGEDMDGRPWLEVLDADAAPTYIESWESAEGDAGMHQAELRDDPVGAAEAVRRLVQLGYISPPSDDVEQTVPNVLRDRKINLAVALTSSNRAAQALQIWQELAGEYPEEGGFKLQLASCYMRLGQAQECERLMDELPDELIRSSYVRLMQAKVALARGARATSLAIALELERQQPTDASILNRLGELFLELGEWERAGAVFQQSSSLQPDNAVALDGLAQVAFRAGAYARAVENSLHAVGLIHFFPAAHFHLGEALAELGKSHEAAAAFETSLNMGYQPAETHRRLAALYRLRNPVRAKFHHDRSLRG